MTTKTVPPAIVSDPSISARWQRVEGFVIDDPDAEEPFSLVLADKMFWSKELTAFMIQEYKKFMLMCSLFPEGSITPSVDIDTVWHLHLLYTRSYFRFCSEALDVPYLHHEPSKGGTDDRTFHEGSYDETLVKYQEVFGTEPPEAAWGCRIRQS
jgi:hypothetical protein